MTPLTGRQVAVHIRGPRATRAVISRRLDARATGVDGRVGWVVSGEVVDGAGRRSSAVGRPGFGKVAGSTRGVELVGRCVS